MLTLICFLIMITGCFNWLMIGLLQYDFIAGLFGYQGSIFSRLFYLVFGIASLYIVFKTVTGKGKLDLINFSFRRKKKNGKTVMQVKDNDPLSPFNKNKIEENQQKNNKDNDKKNLEIDDRSEYEDNKKKNENTNIFNDINNEFN